MVIEVHKRRGKSHPSTVFKAETRNKWIVLRGRRDQTIVEGAVGKRGWLADLF